jgi:hypothetical protein
MFDLNMFELRSSVVGWPFWKRKQDWADDYLRTDVKGFPSLLQVGIFLPIWRS